MSKPNLEIPTEPNEERLERQWYLWHQFLSWCYGEHDKTPGH